MHEFFKAIIGPLALLASDYHRRYYWKIDHPAANPHLYVHYLPQQSVPQPSPAVADAAIASLFGVPWFVYLVLSGMLIGSFLIPAYYIFKQPRKETADASIITENNNLKNSIAGILTQFKALPMGRVSNARLATLWSAQVDDLRDNWSAQVDEVQDYYTDLLAERSLERTLVLKYTAEYITDEAKKVLQEQHDLHESQRQKDRDEIKRLTDENNRKDRDHDEKMNKKDRDHADDMEQKDLDHADDIKQKDRDHAKEMEQKDRDHAIEMNQKDRDHAIEMSQKASDHANEIGALKTNHQMQVLDLISDHEGAITALKDDFATTTKTKEAKIKAVHEAAMEKALNEQQTDLTARHSQELSTLRNELTEKVRTVVSELDDAQQEAEQQRQHLDNLDSEWQEHLNEQLGKATAPLRQTIADLKAALALAQEKARTEETFEGASAAPSTQGLPEDGHSAETPLDPKDDGAGSEINVSSAAGDAPNKKSRKRKSRAADKASKNPEGMSIEQRATFIAQEVGRRSQNGLITFKGIDWAAITDALEGWNGYHIGRLIEEAKIVAQNEARAQGNPRRGNAVTQADFERAIPNVDFSQRDPVGHIPTAEVAAAANAAPLSWDKRQDLFKTYRANHDKVKRSNGIDWHHITNMTTNFHGSEVKRVINLLIEKKLAKVELIGPIQAQDMVITQADLESTILEHKAGLDKYKNEDGAQENDKDGSGEPDNHTPSNPLPPRPPPNDGSNGNQTPTNPLPPRPPPTDKPIKPGHEVYTPPRRIFPPQQ